MPTNKPIEHTPSTLEAYASTLDGFAADIRDIAAQMQSASMPAMPILNDAGMKLAFDKLGKFKAACERSIREARISGAFAPKTKKSAKK